jgi:aconitate hydratase
MPTVPPPKRRDLGGARAVLDTAGGPVSFYRLAWISELGLDDPLSFPKTKKILLENVLRRAAQGEVPTDELVTLIQWTGGGEESVSFMPARVLMQDFTGVPAVVDLAALRDAVAQSGGDPAVVEPRIPADLVIDHSIQVDKYGTAEAARANQELEHVRNAERFALLKWAQSAFRGLRVVPPGKGICHQVNLEYLARVVRIDGGLAVPDTVIGTDSHTTMVNGLGVLGWGVGGIEAEAAMMGRPLSLSSLEILGVQVVGALAPGATATDLALTLTETLRRRGVVGSFIEFFGPGLAELPVPDRATLANMCPEYGATAALFPVDARTLRYLAETGRSSLVDLVERYTKEQGLFHEEGDPEPAFGEVLVLDLALIEPSVAGPRRPQDRVPLAAVSESFSSAFPSASRATPNGEEPGHGSVVIAAITSCTNTSNPSVMVGAGLVAKKAVEAGLTSKPWVKTSLAPGSRVVTSYLDRAGLTPYLEKLGFALVGYGCTTCIGNSGPLTDEVARAVQEGDLAVVAVLSGNRNFEGRIHPLVRASYLASPPLCVAYAVAGRVDLDLSSEALGTAPDGSPVYLRDLWPSGDEVASVMAEMLDPDDFVKEYGSIFSGDYRWDALPTANGARFEWDPRSTYVKRSPFLEGPPRVASDIVGARVLLMLRDSITTDHISPAGTIGRDSPAGQYLREQGVQQVAFNSYGARRGNHEVMVRGTFANPRLRNLLAPDLEGGWTLHLPDDEGMAVFDAASRYRAEGVPLVIVAGRDYGSGSSRDWAAKGTALLGVRAVLAESFERIHRSNLLGMGVLPLQFSDGDSVASLRLTGKEQLTIRWPAGVMAPRAGLTVEARPDQGSGVQFEVQARLDTSEEVEIYRSGGMLPSVLNELLAGGKSREEEP